MIRPKHAPKINEATCDNCGNTYLYDDEDLKIGLYGHKGFDCPECGEFIFVGERAQDPTFPTTFHHNQGTDLSDEDIQGYVYEAWENLKRCAPGEFSMCGSGNVMVFGLKFEDVEDIYVCKNYWEDCVWHD